MTRIIAKVISQEGTCEAGHKVGDEFIIGQKTASGMCSWAFYTLFPFAEPLEFGGSFPWEANDGEGTFACPDHLVRNVFQLKRVKDHDHLPID